MSFPSSSGDGSTGSADLRLLSYQPDTSLHVPDHVHVYGAYASRGVSVFTPNFRWYSLRLPTEGRPSLAG